MLRARVTRWRLLADRGKWANRVGRRGRRRQERSGMFPDRQRMVRFHFGARGSFEGLNQDGVGVVLDKEGNVRKEFLEGLMKFSEVEFVNVKRVGSGEAASSS